MFTSIASAGFIFAGGLAKVMHMGADATSLHYVIYLLMVPSIMLPPFLVGLDAYRSKKWDDETEQERELREKRAAHFLVPFSLIAGAVFGGTGFNEGGVDLGYYFDNEETEKHMYYQSVMSQRPTYKIPADATRPGSPAIEVMQYDAPGTYSTQARAARYCENLEANGHDDWRLPDMNTLAFLRSVQNKDALKDSFAVSAPANVVGANYNTLYWSGDIKPGTEGKIAGLHDFGYGSDYEGDSSKWKLADMRESNGGAWVRCVR